MMNSITTSLRRAGGFTLVEAIVVMVVTGILAGIMVLFIRRPVQNYADASGRADLADTADLALRRMARELRSALPNSIRVTSSGGVWWVQFIPTKAGLQYLVVEDNPAPGYTPLSFTDSTSNKFDAVGPMPAGSSAIAANTDFMVIYNLGNGISGADAYSWGNLARITNVTMATVPRVENLITMAGQSNSNPYANSAGLNSSPDHRFSVVTLPVTFRCEGKADGTGTLTRIVAANYNDNRDFNFFTQVQPTPDLSTNPPKLASNVVGCDFSYTQTVNLQTGLIGMGLTLGRLRTGGAAGELETVTLVDQIHVDNTP